MNAPYENGLDALRKQFGEGTDWHIWRAHSYKDRLDGPPGGDYVATRLSDSAGIDATVVRSTADDLADALREQADLIASGRKPYAVSRHA